MLEQVVQAEVWLSSLAPLEVEVVDPLSYELDLLRVVLVVASVFQ